MTVDASQIGKHPKKINKNRSLTIGSRPVLKALYDHCLWILEMYQDLKYIREGDPHSGTALLDCKFNLKDFPPNTML